MNSFITKIVVICPECNESISFNIGRLDNQIFPDAQFVKCLGCGKIYEFRFEDLSQNTEQGENLESRWAQFLDRWQFLNRWRHILGKGSRMEKTKVLIAVADVPNKEGLILSRDALRDIAENNENMWMVGDELWAEIEAPKRQPPDAV